MLPRMSRGIIKRYQLLFIFRVCLRYDVVQLLTTFEWPTMKECLQLFQLTIFGTPKYSYLAYLATFGHIWPYLAYLGAPNMVKWGVPEKIMQNAVQMHWPCVNRTPYSKAHTCKKRVMWRRRLFWPKKNCGKSAKIATKCKSRQKCVNRENR